MTTICYKSYKPRRAAQEVIDASNEIVADFQKDGFDLTLRQLYYQLVSKNAIPNTDKSYSRLGNIISKARLGGLISWTAIVDRTRVVRSRPHWEHPKEILRVAWESYFVNMWEGQRILPEVWVEKDALIGVLAKACKEYDVPYFSCRGFVSQTAMWDAAIRARRFNKDGTELLIIHLGDHDPSGIDMTRDIRDRIYLLSGGSDFAVKRVAMNMDQITQFGFPPNPAKVTDSRFEQYQIQYGDDSWELDAIDPREMVEIIQVEIRCLIDLPFWNRQKIKLESGKSYLKEVYEKAVEDKDASKAH